MKLTVDASVVVKWFVQESLFEEARLLLAHRLTLYAPDMLLAEFANTIWKKARRNEISDTRPYLGEVQSLDELVSLVSHKRAHSAGDGSRAGTRSSSLRLSLSCLRGSDRISVGYCRS